MILNALISGDWESFLISLLLALPVVLISLPFHEVAHGLIACKLGDPTAKNMGRLNLNPAKHMDPIGFLCMLFFGFGWAKPVPINTRYFKKPKRDMAICALAGPISNLILAVIFVLIMRVVFFIPGVSLSFFWQEGIGYWLCQFLLVAFQLNVTLAVFNLLPIPPLDGSRLFLSFLPANLYFKLMRYERVISLVLMLALFVGLLDTPIRLVSNFFINLIWQLIF